MLSLYHEVTTRGACTVKKELQIQQCCAVNSGLLRTVHSATCARLEHPLRYLEESSLMVLFQTATIEGPSTLNKCSMNPDRTPIPRMPRITDLAQFSTMGIRLSTCTIRDDPTPVWGRAFQICVGNQSGDREFNGMSCSSLPDQNQGCPWRAAP
jgi:hypothetical protein